MGSEPCELGVRHVLEPLDVMVGWWSRPYHVIAVSVCHATSNVMSGVIQTLDSRSETLQYHRQDYQEWLPPSDDQHSEEHGSIMSMFRAVPIVEAQIVVIDRKDVVPSVLASYPIHWLTFICFWLAIWTLTCDLGKCLSRNQQFHEPVTEMMESVAQLPLVQGLECHTVAMVAQPLILDFMYQFNTRAVMSALPGGPQRQCLATQSSSLCASHGHQLGRCDRGGLPHCLLCDCGTCTQGVRHMHSFFFF